MIQAGHARGLHENKFLHLEDIMNSNWNKNEIFVVVDRIDTQKDNKSRLVEAISLSIKHGHGLGQVRDHSWKLLNLIYNGLRSPESGRKFPAAHPSAFSFNSPVGACVKCKGFGRIIEIDPTLVIPDQTLSIVEGAVKAFSGKVYGHCLDELIQACKDKKIPTNTPWKSLTKKQKNYIWQGDPTYSEGSQKWHGIDAFFKWIEKKTYKMHVRVFLSK